MIFEFITDSEKELTQERNQTVIKTAQNFKLMSALQCTIELKNFWGVQDFPPQRYARGKTSDNNKQSILDMWCLQEVSRLFLYRHSKLL